MTPVGHPERPERGETLTAEGDIVNHHLFQPTKLRVQSNDTDREFVTLEEVPESQRARLANHLQHEGVAYVGVVGYEAGALLRFIDRRLGDSHD